MKPPVFSLVVVVPLCGCYAPKTEPAVWTPKPRVEWSRVNTVDGVAASDGYRILVVGPTKGLFPANLAVTRVSLEPVETNDQAETPQLYADPRNEFLQWNSTFDDQMAVSEVFPIAQRDLGGGDADPDQILAAFRGLHARLGLLYAVNELSETETEMFGTLYDTQSGDPLAVLHAQARSVAPIEDEEGAEAQPDLWRTDSRALVRTRFASFAQRCMLELIRNDQPAVVEAPTGWTPAGPIRPVEWPPRNLRTAPGP